MRRSGREELAGYVTDAEDIGLVKDLAGSIEGVAEVLPRLEAPARYAETEQPAGSVSRRRDTLPRECEKDGSMSQSAKNDTELRMEHDMLSVLLEQVDEEVIVVDGSGAIIRVNGEMLQTWGGTVADYLGKDCLSVGHDELEREDWKQCVKAALNSDEKIVDHYIAVSPEGKARHYLVRIFPYVDSGSKERRVVMTRLDVSRETELLHRVQNAQKMAVIGEMMAYVSHEIRNPLMSIGGFASHLARREELPEEMKRNARIIAEEAGRLENILKTIMSYARPSELHDGCVDVNLVAKRARDVLKLNPKNNVPIQLELSSSVRMVSADQDKLVQCLINLVKNACEAVSGKDGFVVIRTRYVDATVYLEVEDNGPGIPEAEQSVIFSPHMTTKREGSGLGLHITRKLILEMGGKIFLHSKENVGTVFSIALPPALELDGEAVEAIKEALI